MGVFISGENVGATSDVSSPSPIIIFFPNYKIVPKKRVVIRRYGENIEVVPVSGFESFVYQFRNPSYFIKPKIFAIAIGVINDSTHESVEHSIPYLELFSYLSSKGYDPLKPIRDKETYKSICRNIAYKQYQVAKVHKFNLLRYVTEQYALQLVNFVKDYIIGENVSGLFTGSTAKAPLENSTINKRNYYDNKYSGLYQSEIEEPLVETGNLLDSIRYRIIEVEESVIGNRLISDSHRQHLRESAKNRNNKQKTIYSGIKRKDYVKKDKESVGKFVKSITKKINNKKEKNKRIKELIARRDMLSKKLEIEKWRSEENAAIIEKEIEDINFQIETDINPKKFLKSE